MQRLDDFLDRFVHVYAVFFLNRVREMADYVSKQDTPRSGLRLTVCLPHTDVQRAVETFLCDPRANHLHRVFITLRSRWNNECAHSFGGLTWRLPARDCGQKTKVQCFTRVRVDRH